MAIGTTHRRRWPSLGISLAIHGAAFIALIGAPGIELPRAAESEYKQAIAGKEEKLVWYKFRKELPEVSPLVEKEDDPPLRAETEAKQSIVSSAKNAPWREQMVWTPAPELAPAPPLESPNILAVKLPDKAFVAPPDIVKPKPASVDVPDAPLEQAQAPVRADIPSTRLPPKAYVAPPVLTRGADGRIAQVEAAPLLAATISPGAPANVAPSKLPPRPFSAPSSGANSTPSRNVAVDAPPAPDLPGNSVDLNIAIVGLNPLDRRAPLPTASSPAVFSAGPKIRPEGDTAHGKGTSLQVPDLAVRAPREAKPDLLAQAYAAPTSKEAIRAALSRGEPMAAPRVMPAPGDAPPGTSKVTNAPDPRFNGRDIYMMAIQMPNLTSYSGSWLMWYSGRTERETGLAPLSPPVAHRKVDPKYVATAVEERVEGRVQLACVIDKDGKVAMVELVRGADARLNQSAEEALAKWEFYPATRNGVPVDVDVLVEIPFKLAPRIPKP